MRFKPIDDMWESVRIARDESDTALFMELMYMGEMVTKIVAAALVAAIEDDREKHRYRQIYRLVRADGLGEWHAVIEDTLLGPASSRLSAPARDERNELTQRCREDTWQHEAVTLLHRCLVKLGSSDDRLPTNLDARGWFARFVDLRNSTRGHGAQKGGMSSALCPDLERSIKLLTENHCLFTRPWTFLHRNLSGKYRATAMSEDTTPYDHLKSSASDAWPDGVYVWFGRMAKVELIHSDADTSDFLFPNGKFDGKKYELISYISNNKSVADAAPYLIPAEKLPESETHGLGELDVQGKSFGNLPPLQRGYVSRKLLEQELFESLTDIERHPIVTLVGRGGIGKTWLALTVLHQIALSGQFQAIVWFSARDIDLLPDGPKLVRPQALTEQEIAEDFARLMQPAERGENGFRSTEYIARALHTSPLGGPLLVIFDNFETTRNPRELFAWIDNSLRLPSKVLITCRFREFKADYPVEVLGMTEEECWELMDTTARTLGVSNLLTTKYKGEVYRESDGHPYVVKVLLGEVARSRQIVKVARIVAKKEEILDALFERTYRELSPSAQRAFLTLCNWRSAVPEVAIQAVLMRPKNEAMDVSGAIEELRQMSLIECIESEQDKSLFLHVPLAASEFGRRKLSVSAMKTAVEADAELLMCFGAAQVSDIRHGFGPRVERMFRGIAERIAQRKEELAEHIDMLEFTARQYPPAWLLLASLYEESGLADALEYAKNSIRRYLESSEENADLESAWMRLSFLCRETGDWMGEAHAIVEMAQLRNVTFASISNAANRLNGLFKRLYVEIDTTEKEILFRKLVDVMAARIKEADAADCSRLAWLCLNLHDPERAAKYVGMGLKKEPDNVYCNRLLSRLSSTT